MTEEIVIALDAMGGDAAPGMVVGGAALACRHLPHVRYVMFGDSAQLEPLLARHSGLSNRVEIRHTDQVVKDDDKPSAALRATCGASIQSSM